MLLRRGRGGCQHWPGSLDLLRAVLLLAGLLWGARGSTALGHTMPLTEGRYLSIGDGSVMEFEFPEESEGIIVISSQYPGQANGTGLGPTLRVTSLDTEVLTIKNVSAINWGSGGGFVVSIHSGLAGLAPLHIQLVDPHKAPPTLIEERRDFCIKVSPAEDAPATLGAEQAHFSENPILYLLLPLIFVNKCSFGCKVELEVLKGLMQSPQPVLLGLLGQFLVMPFYAFLMAKVFMLPKALALGLIITCSSPGGGGSYLFSLLLGGDVTLAISMTFISTVAATGFLPLSSAIYSHLLSIHETLHVPMSKILGTLLFIAIPIAAGVVIKSKLPKFSQLLLQVIKPFSFVLLLGGLFLAYRMGVFILAGVRLPIVLVGLTVPLVGLLVGYCLATCMKLPVAQRRTVSIEVPEDEQVSTLKQLVSEKLNVPVRQQRLLFKGKALADGKRLSDYSIGPNSKLNLVVKPLEKVLLAEGTARRLADSPPPPVWHLISKVLARHFSAADASRVLEQLQRVRRVALDFRSSPSCSQPLGASVTVSPPPLAPPEPSWPSLLRIMRGP
uniref:Ubiquitin-like protein 4A n=1 Tax=Oryctolagus cuniculus TaxID=9986 RepID=A0A5F9C1X6_RABIT